MTKVQYFTACSLDGFLLPRRITSSRMRFREARQSGQRVRVILDVGRD